MNKKWVPDDLVIEILSRLPSKSLSRFRCVSNLWRDFISDVFTNRRRTLLPLSRFFIDGIFIPIAPEPRQLHGDFQSRLKMLPFYSKLKLIHSCNGLLLFSCMCFYLLWNPATMEFDALPDRLVIIKIYSSMTRTWVTLSAPRQPLKFLSIWKSSPVFHKGALHMIYMVRYLVQFDINKRCFHLIMLPGKAEGKHTSCIGESRGHLYYAEVSILREMLIYMLDEQNTDEWLLVHKMSNKNELLDVDFRPIAFHPELELMYLSVQSKILSYHPSTGKLEEICSLTDYGLDTKLVKVLPVIPCLESLDPSLASSR